MTSEKYFVVFSLVVNRGHSWSLVCTFRQTKQNSPKNCFPNPADDLISAVRSFRYMLHKKSDRLCFLTVAQQVTFLKRLRLRSNMF